MRIKIEFILTGIEECEWKVQKKLSHLLFRLKPYKTGERWHMDLTYVLEQESELYKEVIAFVKDNKKFIEFERAIYSVKLEQEDYEKAVAYIPLYPDYYCEEYEDISNNYIECPQCGCKREAGEHFYVQPKGYIKRHFDDYGMAGIDTVGGKLLLLPKLVERLIDGGVASKYFESVLSKSKKIMGYTYMTKNILPLNSLKNDNYEFMNECPLCGGVQWKEKENEYRILPKYMKKEVLQYLEDVNYTAEFFDGYQEIIVSKKVAEIISKYVKYAEFIPIFLEK